MTEAEDRSQEILELCDSWVKAATPEGGGLQISAAMDNFRLRNNGVVFHELTHAELRAAIFGLTRVLLHPGRNTVIDFDHYLAWSWCAEVFVGTRANYFATDEREPKQLFGLACRAALATTYRPDQEGFEKNRERLRTMEPNTRELVLGSHTLLAYLTFPLLEAILRKTCAAYVTADGKVATAFDVNDGRGGRRSYAVGARISNLGHLLWLLYETVADVELVADLDRQRAALTAIEAGVDPFDLLFDWRNSSLHGETTLPTIGGTVLNTAILIALGAVRDDYESLRDTIIEHLKWQLSTQQLSGFRPSWSYYPPW
jgi:hypothetical protein